MDYHDVELQKLLNVQESFDEFVTEKIEYQVPQFRAPSSDDMVVVHQVTVHDTLEGVALQYGVSPTVILEYNGLTSDSIFYLKSLKIPNPQDFYESHNPKTPQDTLKDLKILYMLAHILQGDDRSDKIALYYLDVNEWDMKKAVNDYFEDLNFDKSQENLQQKSQTKSQKKSAPNQEQKTKKIEMKVGRHKVKVE